jgi:hypothetical protein
LGSEESEIKFEKGIHALTTRPAKKNADRSMNWIKCVYLGLQIGEFRKSVEEIDRN